MPIMNSSLLLARPKTIIAVAFACLLLLSTAASASKEIAGVWLNDTGQGAIEIRACGESMCGYIVWLKNVNGRDGRPLRDRLNPKAARRNQPICGLQVIGRLKPQDDGSWDKGWIYDPKQGKSFDVEVRRTSVNGLQVKGYLGMKFLSETYIWRRVEGEFARCQTG